MYIFNLNDGRGLLEVTVFPKLYREFKALLVEGKLIVIEGKLDAQESRARLQVARIQGECKVRKGGAGGKPAGV